MQFEAKVTSVEKFEADPALILHQMRKAWAKLRFNAIYSSGPYIANNWWIAEVVPVGGNTDITQKMTVRTATEDEIKTWEAFNHLDKVFSNVSE